jgi:hypothetical protein
VELETALSKVSSVDAVNGVTTCDWQVLDTQLQQFEPTSFESERPISDQWPHDSSALAPAPMHEQPFTCSDARAIAQQDDVDCESTASVTEILRNLSIEASGGYIGASSNITMGKLISSLVKRKDSITSSFQSGFDDEPSPRSLYHPFSSIDTGLDAHVNLMQSPLCDKLLLGYLKHMSLRWPLLRTSFIRSLHDRRSILTGPYEATVLHLVYAIGGRFLETTGQLGAFSPEEHHTAALQHLDEILEYNDIRTIEVLLLLSLYSLRAPKGPGAWTYVGLAMRLCIDLGLHRRTKAKGSTRASITTFSVLELRKRVFWTAYCLDRQVSIVLGRPFSISDHDIDAEVSQYTPINNGGRANCSKLPLNINEDVEDESELAQNMSTSKAQSIQGLLYQKPTSMSCFIHICRLRIIESNIQQAIYRVDDPASISELEVEGYIEQLEHWRSAMPRHDACAISPYNSDFEITLEDYDAHVRPSLCCQRVYKNVCESQMVYYYKCMRFLLHPHLLSSSGNPRFLAKCVEACGGVCQTYKRLHQRVSVGFSLMALHSVFLAGLTLIYCTWLSPKSVFGMKTCNDMNACSIVLYIITERWPAAKKYRDVFENVKQAVLDSIEDNGYEERKSIGSLKQTLQNTLDTRDKKEEGQLDFEAMIADMAGGYEQRADESFVDTRKSETELLSFASTMQPSAITFSRAELGSGTGLSPDAFSNQLMLELNTAVEY